METRALDFKNIVILSMNDDCCPGNRSSSPSFIPYGLRMAYGLPTPEHQESMYAYYFARLIQRAERIDLVYCSTSDDKSSGEPSRYIHQLDFESPHKVVRREMVVRAESTPVKAIVVEKTPEIMAKMERYTVGGDKRLSPTQLFKFVECPLKFYFSAIAAIKAPDELSEEVDNAMFGTILHHAMEKGSTRRS
ncbi:MAG: PD-(D/E)XK nuclease family protein [Alistipes putredinis]|nr:MAG: PD-(D/E)XK nuclease family protein [Alistipes putredinis]